MAFPVIARGTEKEAYQLYTAERYPVGTQLIAEDGRIWRFAENGGVALLAGVLCQGTVSDPAFADIKDETIDTMAAGETVMTGCDVTTNAVAADLLKYGYFYSSTATGTAVGFAYRIKSNTLLNLTVVAGQNTITLYTPLVTAIAAADTYSAIANPWRNVVVHASPATATLTGVTALAVPIDNFCWLQTKGIAAVLTEGTLVIGKACVPSISTTDGAVAPETVTGTDEIRVGKVVNVEATTEFSLIDLGLD